jgi:hypothetical protein
MMEQLLAWLTDHVMGKWINSYVYMHLVRLPAGATLQVIETNNFDEGRYNVDHIRVATIAQITTPVLDVG